MTDKQIKQLEESLDQAYAVAYNKFWKDDIFKELLFGKLLPYTVENEQITALMFEVSSIVSKSLILQLADEGIISVQIPEQSSGQ